MVNRARSSLHGGHLKLRLQSLYVNIFVKKKRISKVNKILYNGFRKLKLINFPVKKLFIVSSGGGIELGE